MAGNQALDDSVATIPASAVGMSGGGDVQSRIESLLGGEEAPVVEEAPAEIEAEEEVAESTPEEEAEESTETEETDEETESDDEEAKDEEEATEEDSDAIELTEEQIAATLGLPEDGAKVDDEGNLLIRTKVDGEVSYVPMKSLVASYQLENHLQKRIQQTAESQKEFEALKVEKTTELQTTVQDATALVVEMENQLTAATQNIDMNALRQNNPGEYAAMQQELAARQANIQQIKGKLGEVIQTQQAEQAAKAKEAQEAYVLEQTDQLITKIPTWSDPEVAKKEVEQLRTASKDAYGFTDEEFDAIGDHRLVLVLMDALKGRSVSNSDPVKKRLKSIPKITKPGTKKSNPVSNKQRAVEAQQQKLKKSGSTRDVADLLLARM